MYKYKIHKCVCVHIIEVPIFIDFLQTLHKPSFWFCRSRQLAKGIQKYCCSFLRVSPLGILSPKPKRFFIFFKPTSLFKMCRDPRKHNKFELLNYFLVCKRKTYIQQTYKRWRKHDKSLHPYTSLLYKNGIYLFDIPLYITDK